MGPYPGGMQEEKGTESASAAAATAAAAGMAAPVREAESKDAADQGQGTAVEDRDQQEVKEEGDKGQEQKQTGRKQMQTKKRKRKKRRGSTGKQKPRTYMQFLHPEARLPSAVEEGEVVAGLRNEVKGGLVLLWAREKDPKKGVSFPPAEIATGPAEPTRAGFRELLGKRQLYYAVCFVRKEVLMQQERQEAAQGGELENAGSTDGDGVKVVALDHARRNVAVPEVRVVVSFLAQEDEDNEDVEPTILLDEDLVRYTSGEFYLRAPRHGPNVPGTMRISMLVPLHWQQQADAEAKEKEGEPSQEGETEKEGEQEQQEQQQELQQEEEDGEGEEAEEEGAEEGDEESQSRDDEATHAVCLTHSIKVAGPVVTVPVSKTKQKLLEKQKAKQLEKQRQKQQQKEKQQEAARTQSSDAAMPRKRGRPRSAASAASAVSAASSASSTTTASTALPSTRGRMRSSSRQRMRPIVLDDDGDDEDGAKEQDAEQQDANDDDEGDDGAEEDNEDADEPLAREPADAQPPPAKRRRRSSVNLAEEDEPQSRPGTARSAVTFSSTTSDGSSASTWTTASVGARGGRSRRNTHASADNTATSARSTRTRRRPASLGEQPGSASSSTFSSSSSKASRSGKPDSDGEHTEDGSEEDVKVVGDDEEEEAEGKRGAGRGKARKQRTVRTRHSKQQTSVRDFFGQKKKDDRTLKAEQENWLGRDRTPGDLLPPLSNTALCVEGPKFTVKLHPWLKHVLLEDWSLATRGFVRRFPCVPTIRTFLSHVAGKMPPSVDGTLTMLDELEVGFNACCATRLLYPAERAPFLEWIAVAPPATAPRNRTRSNSVSGRAEQEDTALDHQVRPPSQICGCAHLLRFLIMLPALLRPTSAEAPKATAYDALPSLVRFMRSAQAAGGESTTSSSRAGQRGSRSSGGGSGGSSSSSSSNSGGGSRRRRGAGNGRSIALTPDTTPGNHDNEQVIGTAAAAEHETWVRHTMMPFVHADGKAVVVSDAEHPAVVVARVVPWHPLAHAAWEDCTEFPDSVGTVHRSQSAPVPQSTQPDSTEMPDSSTASRRSQSGGRRTEADLDNVAKAVQLLQHHMLKHFGDLFPGSFASAVP